MNFTVPTIAEQPVFFMSYLVVSSIQMGANIDYAIVIASRFVELKDKMPKKQAIIETMNFAFPTILTSGTILAVAGTLIGKMTSEAAIAGIGQSLGRGTIISIIMVAFSASASWEKVSANSNIEYYFDEITGTLHIRGEGKIPNDLTGNCR